MRIADRQMSTLAEILADSTVEVHESTAVLDPEAFAYRRRMVESKENRAVAGVVWDDRDRLLLARYDGESHYDGWRLPGSAVGNVTDFEPRLRDHLGGLLGERVVGVEPAQVQKHVARPEDDGGADGEGEREDEIEEASLFYVLCDATLDSRPVEMVERAETPEGVELDWFAEKPDDVINEGVLTRLFGER